MSEIESRSANASDVGLIVQGVLILLSSLVAIGGYIVQGRMRSKERAREIVDKRKELSNQKKIERIQEKLSVFVGPAQMLGLHITSNIGYLVDYVEKFFPEEIKIHQERCREKGETWSKAYKGEWNRKWSMVGPEVEELFKKDPMHECAVYYRDFMTYTINEFGIPLSKLIRKYAGYLQEWESEVSFKKSIPSQRRTECFEICSSFSTAAG